MCHAGNPNEAWVRAQTEAYLKHAKQEQLPVKMLFHDRDGKFTPALDADLAKQRIDVRKTAFRAPNTNAYVERFIQTIQQECLDHFVILGERHFNHLVTEWLEHYHDERPHQGMGNQPLKKPNKRGRPKKQLGPIDDQILPMSDVRCKQRLGGLLRATAERPHESSLAPVQAIVPSGEFIQVPHANCGPLSSSI